VGILRARLAIALAVAGCYSPDVRDCALPCATSADCAQDQICGSDKMCTSSAVSCESANSDVDAGAGGGAIDAMPSPPGMVPVTVTITGTGNVMIGGVNCMSTSCTVQLAQGMPAMAMAMAKNGDMFTSWTSTVCAGQPMNCMFTPTGATEIAVLFSKKL
jgi:hypothetical protein